MRQTAIVLAGLAAVSLALVGCDVSKKQEGDVTLPKYDVTAPKVDVTTTEKQVTVPKVTTEKETITLPKVEVTPAKDRDDKKVAEKK
jgi:hypothetical protein